MNCLINERVFVLFTCIAMCEFNERDVLDTTTPPNVYLSAYYKQSFAYHTVKNRMPVVVTQVIDTLTRTKEEIVKEYGGMSQEEIKDVISALSELKYEIQTNKVLRDIKSDAPDVKFYNDYIANQTTEEFGLPRYFHTIWLLSECYMYRRIREALELTQSIKKYDPFQRLKEEAFSGSVSLMRKVAEPLLKLVEASTAPNREDFIKLLKLNLWGNRCDLSFGTCALGEDGHDSLDVSMLDSYILSDHTDEIWEAASDSNATSNVIDIVLDNAAYELFTDFCLADYIISTNMAQKIRFYVKNIPWFVSDTMTKDFHWSLSQIGGDSNQNLAQLGERWFSYIKAGIWTIEEEDFWTLPVDYSLMKTVDPNLYNKLGESKLIIFKGDLNYRKLFGEKNWDPSTSIEMGLQGFNPGKLCTLRTLKADIACGIDKEVVDNITKTDEKWMISGQYGVIQFCDNV